MNICGCIKIKRLTAFVPLPETFEEYVHKFCFLARLSPSKRLKLQFLRRPSFKSIIRWVHSSLFSRWKVCIPSQAQTHMPLLILRNVRLRDGRPVLVCFLCGQMTVLKPVAQFMFKWAKITQKEVLISPAKLSTCP